MKSILIPVVVGLFSLNFLLVKKDLAVQRMTELERFVGYAQSVQDVDKTRQATYRMIDHVILRFNPAMPDEQRKAIADVINEMAIKYPNLDVPLICATITHESGRSWNPQALSRAGAMGLMQIMPSTGRWLARVEGIEWTSDEQVLFNPVHNIRLGTRYLSTLIEMYGLEGGLAAYNGGGTIARRWLASNKADEILFAETRAYIPYVLKLYDEFKKLTI